MFITYLLLGSNLGDRQLTLEKARSLIAGNIGRICSQSSLYETASWGKTDQPDFLNQVVAVGTNLSPFDLLTSAQKIEIDLGRERLEKWGSRTIDIDILLYEDQVIDTPELSVPHKLLHKRRFCLEPLAEIASEHKHPLIGLSIAELLSDLTDSLLVKKLT